MADMGMDLLLTGRDRRALDELAAELAVYPVNIVVLVADLALAEAPQAIIGACRETFDRLDVLVNNAGLAISKTIAETTVEDWDRLMHVNARAPFFLAREAIALLKRSSEGTVINISSVVGRLGYPMQAAYGASKHALLGFSKVLAKELQKDNIRVHVIAPGGVDTDLVQEMRPDIDREALIGADEIADIVAFLIGRRGNGVIDEINVRRASGTPWA
jgi:3-oxoacyl-[acyl-carrier protein] reductase